MLVKKSPHMAKKRPHLAKKRPCNFVLSLLGWAQATSGLSQPGEGNGVARPGLLQEARLARLERLG